MLPIPTILRREAYEPLRRKRLLLTAVTLEVGQGAARISAAARSDGTIHFGFGTGEEFVGAWAGLPADVGVAARRLLDVAAPFVGRLPEPRADASPAQAAVVFGIHTADAVYHDRCSIADLRSGRTRLAPLWSAFSDLLRPTIVVLFANPSSPGAERSAPGLRRARGLWG